MKKFNKNIIVFVAVFLFIGFGFTSEYIQSLKTAVYDLIFEDIAGGNGEWLSNFSENVEQIPSDELRYHKQLLDVDSLKQNVLNTRIIVKDDATLLKTDTGSIIWSQKKYLSDEALDESIERIGQLQNFVNSHDGEFLYVAAPFKGYGLSLPENAEDYNETNYDRMLEKLKNANIPTLNLAALMKAEGLLNEDSYFETDHHWKPEAGFWATGAICEELFERYGFDYNRDYTDLSNFHIDTYKEWFLGSLGRKVGRYYTPGGVEDISLITPAFETNLTDKQPLKEQVKEGNFKESVLYMENIEGMNHYYQNPYVVYSGGDFRLQIIQNNLNTEGKKILIVRDSFACVVTPFLALNASEVHVLDVRDANYYYGDKLDVYEYIREIQPDYVLALYAGASGVTDSDGRYDFGDLAAAS